jgi:hypothetical protein
MTNPFTSAHQAASPGRGASPRQSAWAQVFAAFAAGDQAGYRHLLVLRFAVVNLVAFALLAAAWLNGWVGLVLAGDTTQLVSIIAVVFLAGLFECGRKIARTSAEIDQITGLGEMPSHRARSYLNAIEGREGQSRALMVSALKLRLTARIASIRHVANSLVFLGLIGTVIGFTIALSGVDPEAAADVSLVGPMVSTLISGMSVALHTTLVGAVLNIWLMVNYRLLESGTVRLLTSIVELGERREQS